MDDNYVGVLFEEIHNQNKDVLEAVGLMQDKMETLATKADLQRVEAKVDTIKLALTATNKDVKDHEKSITKLEQIRM